MKATKKRNPQDATLRNKRALKKRLEHKEELDAYWAVKQVEYDQEELYRERYRLIAEYADDVLLHPDYISASESMVADKAAELADEVLKHHPLNRGEE